MAKKGTFAQVSPEKLFTWLYNKRMTGTLTVLDGADQKWLFLKDGKVIHAHSKSEADQLEQVLLREGVLSKHELDSYNQTRNGKTLTQTLLERGIIQQSDLNKFKKVQVRDIALSIFDWKNGEFIFQQDTLPQKRFTEQNLPLDRFIEYHKTKSQRREKPVSRNMSAAAPSRNLRSRPVTSRPTTSRRMSAPKPDSILRIRPQDDIKKRIASMSSEEQDVLLLFNGRRTLKEAISKSKVPGKKMLPILASLIKGELLEDTSHPTEPEPEDAEASKGTTVLTSDRVDSVRNSMARKTPSTQAPQQEPPSAPDTSLPPALTDAQMAFKSGLLYAAHEKVKDYLKEHPTDARAKALQKEYANALLEGIKKTMVSMKSVPTLTREMNFNDWNSLSLDNRAAFVLTRIDGHANLKQIMSSAGFSKGELCMIVYRLMEAGIVTIETGSGVATGTAIDESDRERLERVLEVHKNLGSMTHYQILGIKPSDSREKMKQAFVKITKDWHPDTFKGKHFEPYLRKINEVFNRAKTAYDTLRNQAARESYETSIGLRAEPETQKKQRKTNYKAKMQYKIAMRCLQRRDYKRATEFLQSAVDMDPEEPLYQLRLAEVESKNARTRQKAKERVQKAIQMEPADPFAYRLLASIYEKEGDTKAAVDMYYRSLNFDSGNAEARERIEILTGKPLDPKYLKSAEGQLIVRKQDS